MDLTLNEIGYWLALYTVPRCGLSTVSMLLKKFDNPKQILLASYEELLHAGVSPILASNLQKPDWKSVEFSLRWVENPQQHILHWGDLHYPVLLREISSPPLVLFIMGELSLFQQQTLAIVGARNPTHTGLEIAYQLATELTDQGFVIISGLARGIDGAAHQGALSKGITMAVLGSGHECIYPVCHKALAMNIVEKGGTLISEFFPYASPKAEYFPRRNRIISGMSLGVIVVEATLRSGSLITARYALEQGREVFAVPGSIRNPLSQGCHALLKEGATLVESGMDIIQEFSFLPEQTNRRTNEGILTKPSKAEDFIAKKKDKAILDSNPKTDLGLVFNHEIPQIKPILEKKDLSGLDSQDIKLVECLEFETTSIDILITRTGLTIDKLLVRLSTLQLQGYIDVVPGGYVRK
ncbi:MAG: DNA-processing protein DprA [Candidatus Rickettsiella isopodorum]|jgi:DNA processing protein|nr:DNA-processing protein DprA [Candidatus Rickettsiella isopodorum]MDD5162149.1 DNA-processing protein DprA [Candidatus Rickettsiella isopodorum]MDQ5899740.1 DprA protein [Pseudomonadota bacterium]